MIVKENYETNSFTTYLVVSKTEPTFWISLWGEKKIPHIITNSVIIYMNWDFPFGILYTTSLSYLCLLFFKKLYFLEKFRVIRDFSFFRFTAKLRRGYSGFPYTKPPTHMPPLSIINITTIMVHLLKQLDLYWHIITQSPDCTFLFFRIETAFIFPFSTG